ncbi:PLP-dependent transferase [Bifidobacterium sp. ESL0745]|uniref:O-acetylhomoserine aminocarboxypropyltransferase/cysteine synthase family protein n=1 Tax=Bifidobacterium sp. ESL0745 TaxID=2983226 RepID=UPI0023F8F4AA|nr:PLP-dependent transferase [Bifidobacterium sp. ESL0745]MDF7664611.1 PLP-dependent transferase [Bifidobacterium sp. ESL0745]
MASDTENDFAGCQTSDNSESYDSRAYDFQRDKSGNVQQRQPLGFETRAIHAGYDPYEHHGSVSVPIYQSAAFAMHDAVRGDGLSSGEIEGFSYSRCANPTVDALERRLANLEGGVSAVALASGMAAVSFALLCAAEGGGRLIAPKDLYGASIDAMESFFPQFGIHTDFVEDINDVAEVESKIGPDTRAVFAESVANPSTGITDIKPLADMLHRHGVALIVDNTVPTPYLFRPIEFGADVVVHSTTKGISGHGDALGGIVVDSGKFDWANGRFPQFTQKELVVSDERHGVWKSFAEAYGNAAFAGRVRIKYLHNLGAVMSPANAYLQLIGLETLPQRFRQETDTALAIARHLESVPHVTQVNYSGLDSSRNKALADRYFPQGIGPVLSFRLEGDESHINRVVDAVKVFSYVPNIGDTHSLIVNPARITHREVPGDYRRAAGVDDHLLRLSIGLERPSDLIADLDRTIAGAY